VKRQLYLGGGLLSVGLGIAGAFIPIVPTVPFLVLAAFCFARSNPTWEARLLNHPRYGQSLRDWRERGAISRKAKISAIAAMTIGVGFTWFTLGWPWVLVSAAVLLISGSWIWTRNE
jgi:uncharacterized membrane protein YbaN (DUF454 family)